MKIVFSAPDWIVSGVNSFTRNLIRGLQAAGHQPELLLIPRPNANRDELRPPPDIPVEFLRAGASARPWESRWRALIEYLNRRTPCIYLPGYDFQNSCVAPCLNSDVIIVGVIHSDDPFHYDHLIRMGRYWNAAIAVSPLLYKKALEIEPEIANRSALIPYGVPHPPSLTFPLETADALKIIYSGRFFERQKRISDLPKIAHSLERRGVPAIWTLIGEGPQENDLKQAFAPFLAAGKAQFPGAMGNEAVIKHYGAHDCFILTSNYEGLPLALLEAMAHGATPVVSATQGGVTDVLRDGVNGFLVTIGEIEGFAERLTRLHANPARRHEMRAAAFATIADGPYSIESATARYIEVFENARKAISGGTWRRPKAYRPDSWTGDITPPPGLQFSPDMYLDMKRKVDVQGRRIEELQAALRQTEKNYPPRGTRLRHLFRRQKSSQ